MARTSCPRRRHGVAAVLTLFASAGHADEHTTNIRCSNSYNRKGVNPPSATVSVHVNDLGECESNCDLFASFDQCAWFIYYTYGPSDNCLLYGPPGPDVMTMETWLATNPVRGQPVLGCPAEIDEGTCDAGTIEEYPYPPMKFAVAGCALTVRGDDTTNDQETYEECLEHCRDKFYNLASDDTPTEAPYMTYDTREKECTCWTTSAFEHNCQLIIFKAEPGAGTMDKYQDCIADGNGGGTTSPPPSPSLPPPSPPIPPQAPALSGDEVKKTVKVTFTVDEECTEPLKLKIQTATATACEVAISNTNVSCTTTSSTRRRRLDIEEVTVTMGTTEANAGAVQAAAESFFGSAGDASTAFGTTVSGATVTIADAVSSGDPHLGFAHGGEADFRGRHGVFYNFFSAPGFGVNIKTEESRFFLHGNKLTVDGTFITEAPHPPPPPPTPARGPCHLAARV